MTLEEARHAGLCGFGSGTVRRLPWVEGRLGIKEELRLSGETTRKLFPFSEMGKSGGKGERSGA